MTTSALLALYAVAIIAAAAGWLAAGFVAVGVGAGREPGSRERWLVVGLAAAGALATVGAAVATVALAARGWWFVGEKAVLGLPLAAIGAVVGAVGLVRWLRGDRGPLGRVLLLAAGYAATAAALTTWLLGYPVQQAAAFVLVAALLLAVGLTWALIAGRGRRAVTGFAGLLVVLLVGGVGWSWLADTAAPSLEAAGHAHAGGDAAAIGAATAAASGTRSVDELRTPTDGAGPVRAFELVAAQRSVTLASGEQVDVWSFGDALPGPELRVTEGDLVDVTLRNDDIDAGVTLHWHGVDVPNGEDGVAGVTQDAIMPGGEFRTRFVADVPGTYWYHTHQASSEGVRMGLYGMLVVEPADEAVADVDLALPVHTIGGEVLLGAADGAQVQEVEPGSTVRLRVANTDRPPLRVLLDGAPFVVAAVDGRDLPGGDEVEDRAVRLAAGARADLVFTMPDAPMRLAVDASRASTLDLVPPGAAASARSFDGGDAGPDVTDAPELDLLAYGDGPAPDLGPFTAEAEMVLDRMPRFVGGVPAYAYTVDGRVFPHIAPIVVREGDVVKLTIANRGFDVHPMHVHGHHVLVLSRDGVPASGAPLWLDTVDVRPGEVWEVALVADNPGIWMDHCHDLEHAAQGMMMSLAYEGVVTPYDHDAHGNRPE